MDTPVPDSSRALLHTVARLHYEQDLSQRDIAQQMQLSTATVSRLIRRARDEGIVRIEISDFVEPATLADRLAEALNLRRVAIAPSAPESRTMAALADPVGRLLKEARLGPRSVLGLGWGRTVWETLQVGLPECPGTTTVPLSGGIPEAARHFQIGEFARLAATQIGGQPKFVHAPYLLADEARLALVKDPVIRDSVDLWDRVDVALVGVGRPHGGGDRMAGGAALTPDDPALDDAAGDVLLRYFDARGRMVAWQDEHKLLAIGIAQLKRIPLLIGLVASPAKAVSVIGAARAGLINALATDSRTAIKVLDCLGV
jgi:DNA-binding transcriptional regulator LsrR (DeoR family)